MALKLTLFSGVNAERAAFDAIRELRKQAPIAASTIKANYKSTFEQQYISRWSLTYLAGELEHESFLKMFNEILDSQIPDEKSTHPEKFRTVEQEVMIRLRAVEGLLRLARKNIEGARETLLKHVKNRHFSVRRAATQAYLECGGQDARQILMRTLPESERYVLDIKPGNIHIVPQPKPETTSAESKDSQPPPLSW